MMSKNEKAIGWFTLAWFLILSTPVFILSFYNVPSADDYTFAQQMHLWIQEHGYEIPGILRCAMETSVDYYFRWQGRYSESFFAAFMPETFGCYWISTILIYLIFAGGMIAFFRNLVRALAGKECIWIGNMAGLVVGMMIVQNVPFPVEAFFWFDGSMAYMFHHAVYLWMCVGALRYFLAENKKGSVWNMLLLCLLTVVAAGGNNVTSFTSILTYVIFAAIALLIRRKRGILFPAVLSFAGFLVSYLSPGTLIRGGGEYSPVLSTIRKCFVWTIRQYVLGWTTPAVLLTLVFLTPFILQILQKVRERFAFRFPWPVLAAAGALCFLSAMSCPSFYVLGEPGPGRLRNVIYVNDMILAVLIYGYLLGWLWAKFPGNRMWVKLRDFYKNTRVWQGIGVAAVVYVVLCAGNFRTYGVSAEAARELLTGEAAVYHREAMERKAVYLDPDIMHAEVEPYSVKPYLLFFDDITDDPGNWKNVGVGVYYGKESVRLNRYDPEVDYD